jgi:hypothetical protein
MVSQEKREGEEWRSVGAAVARMATEDKDLALRVRAQKLLETDDSQDGIAPMEI